jgi:hypothetical protein
MGWRISQIVIIHKIFVDFLLQRLRRQRYSVNTHFGLYLGRAM